MSKPWILVTPSSRGIGAALTRHLLRTTTLPILATCRKDIEATRNSLLPQEPTPEHRKRLTVVCLDVTHEDSVSDAATTAASLFPPSSHHLHLALAIPGILRSEKSAQSVVYEDAVQTFKVNTLGPMMLMKHFLAFLPRKHATLAPVREPSSPPDLPGSSPWLPPAHATWLNMSARVGSTSDNSLGGWYSYRASKAGLNSLTRTFDLQLRNLCRDKAIAIAYHPGTVKTDLSREFWANVREDKLFAPEFAVEKMLELVRTRGIADRGRIWDWAGDEILP